jgi:hypothetical protein
MSRAKSLAAAVIILLKGKKSKRKEKCALESGLQEEKKKGLAANY